MSLVTCSQIINSFMYTLSLKSEIFFPSAPLSPPYSDQKFIPEADWFIPETAQVYAGPVHTWQRAVKGCT